MYAVCAGGLGPGATPDELNLQAAHSASRVGSDWLTNGSRYVLCRYHEQISVFGQDDHVHTSLLQRSIVFPKLVAPHELRWQQQQVRYDSGGVGQASVGATPDAANVVMFCIDLTKLR